MVEARFLIDSAGEATHNQYVLDVAGAARAGVEAERIETDKAAVRVMHGASVRIRKGLLLDAGPEDGTSPEDRALENLPTEEFEIVAAVSDDPDRMARIRSERQARKTVIDRDTPEGRERWARRLEEARKRLEGRPAPSGRRKGKQ